MTILWCAAAVAVVMAGLALASARRSAALAARLSESYWELRYEHGQLASRLDRAEAQLSGRAVEGPLTGRSMEDNPAAQNAGSFIPLSSLKR